MAAEYNVVHHQGPEGIVFYPGVGKTCPDCLKYLGKEIFFSNSHDMACHRLVCDAKVWKMGWKPSGRGDNKEWTSVDKDPDLVRQIRMNGPVVLAGFKHSVSLNGKWLIRESL